MTEQIQPRLLSVEETAQLLGVSRKTVRRLVDQRKITFVRIQRRVLISVDSVEEYLERNTVRRIDTQEIARKFLAS